MEYDFDSMKLRLIEITKIRDKNGYLAVDDPASIEREDIIDKFITLLNDGMKTIHEGIQKTKVGWKAPIINGLRYNDKVLCESARRISWELYSVQFPKEIRSQVIGAENDPFYNPEMPSLLSDTELLSLESYKSSAEKRYRTLIKQMKSCYIMKDQQAPP